MQLRCIFLLTCLLFQLGCARTEINKDIEEIKAPFDGMRFDNIEPYPDKSFFDVLKWRLFGPREKWPDQIDQKSFAPANQRSGPLTLTLIGHSTVLIQIDGINILTDPHFSERASVVTWAGPRRVRQPAIPFEELPPIDLVLISHNHYDHLDIPTLVKLRENFNPTFLVGLGNGTLLKDHSINNFVEMDWWDTHNFGEMNLHFVPVQHWSARSIGDRRMTLWGGFFIEAAKKIFFAGDTGYGIVFQMIREKYGPMDVGLIPIGAYEPRNFMRYSHVNPEEAVKIYRDLGLKKGFGIHFGTFKDLTDEAIEQPVIDLKKALDQAGIAQEDFIAPDFGPSYHYE